MNVEFFAGFTWLVYVVYICAFARREISSFCGIWGWIVTVSLLRGFTGVVTKREINETEMHIKCEYQ